MFGKCQGDRDSDSVNKSAGVDPGFSVVGCTNPRVGAGRQHIIFLDFPKRCMKLRTFLSVGAEGGLSGASPCTLPIRH